MRKSAIRVLVFAASLGCLLAGMPVAQAQVPTQAPQVDIPPGARSGRLPQTQPLPLPGDADSDKIFEIPPVFERPLGVDQGERVFVRGFRLLGVIDDPAAGISRSEAESLAKQRLEALLKLVEELRIEKQNLEDIGKFGFTPEEEKKIMAFMNEVTSNLSPDRRMEAYQRFVDQLRIQRLQRSQGLTIGQLQLVANAVTQYYHEHGYFLARAVIPAQTVESGVIDIQVLEGRLGDVQVEGNESYSAQWLKAPFADLQGELITVQTVETALLTLKNYPGLDAYGVFRPGSDVGQADIVINVQSEEWYSAYVRADNHGTLFTGKARLLADFVWNNPISGADELGITALKTFDPDNALYGQLRYSRALPDPSYRVGVELNRNTFIVNSLGGINIIGIEIGGVAQIGRIKLEKYFQRSRQASVWGTVDLARKRADTLFGSLIINRDDLAVLGLQLNYERIDSSSATINAGFVRLDVGLDGIMGVPDADEIAQQEPLPSRAAEDPDGNGLIYASSDFTKLTLGYSRLKSITPTQSVLFRVSGQYTNDILTTLEQFVLGGPGSVRAIPVSQFLADTGLAASLEYSVRAPFFADVPAFAGHTWGQLLGFSVFIDHGVGLTNNPLPSQSRRIEVTGYGVGVQFGVPGMFNLNIEAARLTDGKISDNPFAVNAVQDDSQVWMSFTWFFN